MEMWAFNYKVSKHDFSSPPPPNKKKQSFSPTKDVFSPQAHESGVCAALNLHYSHRYTSKKMQKMYGDDNQQLTLFICHYNAISFLNYERRSHAPSTPYTMICSET